jgi:glycolate oxidase FAD binding subunit
VDAARYAGLADAIRECEAARIGAWIRGAGTLCEPPPGDFRVLDIRPYADLIAHARADMTVTVQAGMSLSELQRVLAPSGQELPLDGPYAARTTVGGLIASSLGGPRRFGRGAVRDALLGVTIVGRHGEVFRGGGRVVKNVAGYDLCKLYAGSWGWLGAIVEATFRIAPRPAAAAAVAFEVPLPADAERLAARVLRAPVEPVSVDLLDAASAAALRVGTGRTLLIGFEGLSAEVDYQVQFLARANLGAGAPARVDAARYSEYCGRAAEAALDAPHAARFSISSASVADFVGALEAGGGHTAIVAHVANGVVWAGFAAGAAGALRAACIAAAGRGGSWLVPRGGQAADLPMLGPARPDWALMRRVKAALDPANVFGRGGPFDRALTVHDA